MAADLPFPKSLPEFQRIFPTDAACASYLEQLRWPEGFACECGEKAEKERDEARVRLQNYADGQMCCPCAERAEARVKELEEEK